MKWVSSADWNTRVLPALSAFNVRKVVLANKGLMRILRTRVLLLVKTSALVASKKPLTMTATYCDLLFHSSWHSTLLQKNRKRLLPDLIWHVCFELRPQSSVLGFCLIGLIQLAASTGSSHNKQHVLVQLRNFKLLVKDGVFYAQTAKKN